MPEISWMVNVSLPGGQKVSRDSKINFEAYDNIEIVVEKGKTQEVQVQPGSIAQLKFLLIAADPYDAAITYSLKDSGSKNVKLDEIQLFLGFGALSLLQAPPQTLVFNNGAAKDVKIQIVAARMAKELSASSIPAVVDPTPTKPANP
jgi:hypothetical protein